MDPNETLKEMRRLSNLIDQTEDEWLRGQYAEELCWAVDSMDEWLSKGGFLPTAWERK